MFFGQKNKPVLGHNKHPPAMPGDVYLLNAYTNPNYAGGCLLLIYTYVYSFP